MRQIGQNVSEYGIAFALIAVVCISVVSLMGDNVSRMLAGGVSKKQRPALLQVETAGNYGQMPEIAPPTGALANLPGKQITVNLGNGKSLSLNMANPVAAAEAAGGNGVTENALAVIQQIADQLKAQGEDPAIVSELEKLATEGQKIKDLQKQIEAKFPPKGFSNATERYNFMTDPANNIFVGSQEMTLLEAAKSLSPQVNPYLDYAGNASAFQTNNKNYEYFSNNPPYFAQSLWPFLSQLKKVESMGVLNNPVMKTLIKDDLAQQIYLSSMQTYTAPNRNEVGALVQTTRVNSNDICSLANAVSCQDRSG